MILFSLHTNYDIIQFMKVYPKWDNDSSIPRPYIFLLEQFLFSNNLCYWFFFVHIPIISIECMNFFRSEKVFIKGIDFCQKGRFFKNAFENFEEQWNSSFKSASFSIFVATKRVKLLFRSLVSIQSKISMLEHHIFYILYFVFIHSDITESKQKISHKESL